VESIWPSAGNNCGMSASDAARPTQTLGAASCLAYRRREPEADLDLSKQHGMRRTMPSALPTSAPSRRSTRCAKATREVERPVMTATAGLRSQLAPASVPGLFFIPKGEADSQSCPCSVGAVIGARPLGEV
jgi:hypothetical protein